MAKTLLGALALAALPSALAFRDTSPFFLFSTADLSINGNNVAIAQSSSLVSQITETLGKCPSGTYIVVRQEGVSSADYLDELSAPRLGHHLGGGNADVKSTMAVSEAVGRFDAKSIAEHLQTKCRADFLHSSLHDANVLPRSKYPAEQLVVYVTFPTPPTKNRAAALDTHDRYLDLIIAKMDPQDFTVIYTTTAQTNDQVEVTLQDQHTYEMENPFGEAVHMELKRDTTVHTEADYVKDGALFERYQYLSPGLFMGISASIPLLIILYVGLTAITGLEVSYFAFSKEMGPAAQRKQ